MTTPFFVADAANVTVLRSVASTAFGKYELKVPEGISIEDVHDFAAPGNGLGYVAGLSGGRVGGMMRRFVRADVLVTAANEADPSWVPDSNVDQVLREAEQRVSGDFFLESDITLAGLGPWVPFVDFQVGDIANVDIWGRVVQLPVTRIEPVVSDHSVVDFKVHVGGQLVSDEDARLAENESTRRALVEDRRDLADLEIKVGKAVEAAESALKAASVAVVSSRVEFAVAESDSVAPVSGWGVSQPAAGPGVWVWQRQVTELGDGRVEYGTPWVLTSEAGPAGPAGPAGRDGLPGKDGVGLKSTTVSYAVSASGTTAPSGGWQASPPAAGPGQFVWTRTVWAYTDGATETGYSVGKIGETGATGADGVPGKDGTTLVSTTITYAASASGTKAPSSGWQASPPAAIPGQFVWTRSVWEYSDGTTETGYSVGKIGNTGAQGPKGDKGDPGADGVPGKNGLGVKSTTVTYAAAASGTTAPLSGWAAQPPAASPGQFVWTRMVLAYTDNSTETVYSVGKIGDTGAQGPKGATGARGATGASGKDGLPGKDGVGLKSTAVTYAVSASGTSAPSGGWQASPPVAKGGQYMWTRFIWTYTDNTTETGYSIGKIGDTGAKGATGAQGPKGATGAQGPQGPQGPRGATGAHGLQGVSVTSVTRFWRWAATKPGTPIGSANPSGWSTTQPAYVVGQKLWTTVRTVLSNGIATWSPTTEEATVSAATAIAQASADGKNRIWYSATAPGSSKGEQAGDTWFRYSGAKIIGQWRWTGSAWQAQTIDNQVIANLDAGKITSGTIDAQRIGAASITAKHLLVSPGNLISNGSLSQGAAGWDSALTFRNTEQSTPPTGRYLITKAGQGSLRAHGDDNWFDVQPGASYAFEIWLYADKPNSNIYIECRNQEGADAGRAGAVVNEGDLATGGSWYLVNNRTLAAKWQRYSCVYTMNADTTRARLATFYFNHPNGSERNAQVAFGGVSLRPMADASLIVDGSIQGRHIQANSINGDRIVAGTLDAKAIKAGTLSADAITSGTISVDRIDTKQVFLNGGTETLDSKHIELQSMIETSFEQLWNAYETLLETRVGMGFSTSAGELVGSVGIDDLFEIITYSNDSSRNLILASGSWTGWVVTFGSDGSFLHPITNSDRVVATYGYPFLFFVESSSMFNTTLKVASNTQFAQSTWVTVGGMSTTAPDRSMRAKISGQVCFTNVHRGSTYGVRLLVGGSVKDTWTSTTFGPLGPLGNPNWYHKFAWEGSVKPGQKIEVQVYCSNGTASKRQVRAVDTSVSVQIQQM